MSPIYQIAYQLGARLQVNTEDSEEWDNSNKYVGLAYDTKYRVHPEDAEILEAAKKLFLDLHVKVKFNDYAYYVPKNAIKSQNPVLFFYGFGVYAIVDKDHNITPLPDQKKAGEDAKNNKFHAYLALSKKVIFDKNTEE